MGFFGVWCAKYDKYLTFDTTAVDALSMNILTGNLHTITTLKNLHFTGSSR